MVTETPEYIYYECPDCDDVIEHDILRGKMGNANITGTFRCRECGRIFTGTIKLPKELPVKVMLSTGDVTEITETTLMEDEIVAVGDEFDLDNGMHVCVTLIDVEDGSRRKKVNAPEVKALWVKNYDVLQIKVSVNDYKKTYPMICDAEPDDEFTVGMYMHFDLWDCVIHAIKTKEKLMRRGTAEARDIVRVYAKIRHRDGSDSIGEGEKYLSEDLEFADDAVMDLDD